MLITSWLNLLHYLQAHFRYSQFDDPQATLFILTQVTTVNDYQAQWETLLNRIIGLPSNALLSCLTSGLKPCIRREVQALQPINHTQAIAPAKSQEVLISRGFINQLFF